MENSKMKLNSKMEKPLNSKMEKPLNSKMENSKMENHKMEVFITGGRNHLTGKMGKPFNSKMYIEPNEETDIQDISSSNLKKTLKKYSGGYNLKSI